MLEFLAVKSLFGAPRWLVVLIALLALSGITALALSHLRAQAEHHDQVQREAGAASAVAAGQQTVIKQVGDANEAGNQVRNDAGGARYDQCLRDVAPGYEAGCERYRAKQPVPGGPDASGTSGAGGGN